MPLLMTSTSQGAAPTVLKAGATTFHVIGTAHVSARSVAQVEALIAELRPDLVCVELCPARWKSLGSDAPFADLDVGKVIGDGRALPFLASLVLTAYQRRIGASLGVLPGAELLAAVKTAREVGADVALIDRDVAITLKRTWANVSGKRRVQLLTSLFVGEKDDDTTLGGEITTESVEQLKEPKALSDMLSELARVMPEIKGPLVDERDLYLTSSMIDAAAHDASVPLAGARGEHVAPARTVVTVVGAAHVPGMTAAFEHPLTTSERAGLDRVAPKSLLRKALPWIGPLLFALAMFLHPVLAMHWVRVWSIPIAISSGLFTLFAGGHIVTIVASVVLAPVATLLPPLGAGRTVGLVQHAVTRASSRDRNQLLDDMQTWRGFRSNSIARIFAVSAAAGIGATLGATIATIWLAVALI